VLYYNLQINKFEATRNYQLLLPLLVAVLAHLEATHQRFIYTHHSSSIVKLSTIVGGGKQRHQLSLSKELIPIFDDLKTSGY